MSDIIIHIFYIALWHYYETLMRKNRIPDKENFFLLLMVALNILICSCIKAISNFFYEIYLPPKILKH